MRGRALALGLVLALAGAATAQGVYIAEGGAVTGPFDPEALKDRLATQAGAAATLVWMQGMAGWQAATEVPALGALVAALPKETPFDAEFLVGRWESGEQPISSGPLTVIGRMSLDFVADGTFTGTMLGRHVRTTYGPGQQPGETVQSQETLSLNSRIKGKFLTKAEGDGFLGIVLTGEEETLKGGKVFEYNQFLEMRREGPDRMRSRYGVVWRRL